MGQSKYPNAEYATEQEEIDANTPAIENFNEVEKQVLKNHAPKKTVTPGYVEDGYGLNKTVTVITKKGEAVTEPAGKWAVVERSKLGMGKCKPKKETRDERCKRANAEADQCLADENGIHPSACPTCPVCVKEPIIEKIIEIPPDKNRITVLVGVGPSGLEAKEDATGILVGSKFAPVVGLEYSRTIEDKFSVSAVGFSNETLAVGAGFSW